MTSRAKASETEKSAMVSTETGNKGVEREFCNKAQGTVSAMLIFINGEH